MLTRRDLCKVLTGVAATAAIPALGASVPYVQQGAVAAPLTGDLLLLDGSSISVSDFPELARWIVQQQEMDNPKWQPPFLPKPSRPWSEVSEATWDEYVENSKEARRGWDWEGMAKSRDEAIETRLQNEAIVTLPKVDAYRQRSGLTDDGHQIWREVVPYIKAVPSEGVAPPDEGPNVRLFDIYGNARKDSSHPADHVGCTVEVISYTVEEPVRV